MVGTPGLTALSRLVLAGSLLGSLGVSAGPPARGRAEALRYDSGPWQHK